MQHVDEQQPSKAYAWLTLALFASLALLIGAAIFMQPPTTQMAQNESPLPVEQVVPPITQPPTP
jgi:hypothetical protein